MGNIIEAARIDELKPGDAKLVEAHGKEIALFNSEGEYYAIDNECTHVGGPLCEGELEQKTGGVFSSSYKSIPILIFIKPFSASPIPASATPSKQVATASQI